MHTSNFANYLVANQLLKEQDAQKHIAKAKHENISLIGYLIKHRILDYQSIAKHVSLYFDLPLVNLHSLTINDLPLNLLDINLIEKYQVLPIAHAHKQLKLATADPSASQIISEIKFHTNLEVKLAIAEFDKLSKMLNEICPQQKYELINNNDDPQIIDFIDQIIADAITKEASDIHFEPYRELYRVRFRIDGLLFPMLTPDFALSNRISARLKIMANLDIAEHRLPQDGRFNFQNRDCRVSICSTLYGEKIVLRLLQQDGVFLTINDLGLEPTQQELLINAINRPQGMILVTGPTGSGKTVSLYSALKELNTPHKNISSVEDPVEIVVPGINQVHINPKIGLDFASVLRSFLRQDPDIIMVGEIRDAITAEIATKAAQTGHLVLATLHTNNAAESITRLLNMGIAPFNLHNTLLLIIAQRLIRKLCPQCKKAQSEPCPKELEGWQIFEPRGCDNCFKGYKGRIGVFEVLPISEAISHMIIKQASSSEIIAQAQQGGFLNLYEAALKKVRAGITDLTEINRVI